MPTIINRRGRPPHPDILTPAEWQVLEGVRAGRTNQEIADALGVTFHTVKFHVANMLAKLQLSDRQELGAWRPASSPESRHRRWQGLLPFGALKVLGEVAAACALGAAFLTVRPFNSGESQAKDAETRISVTVELGEPLPGGATPEVEGLVVTAFTPSGGADVAVESMAYKPGAAPATAWTVALDLGPLPQDAFALAVTFDTLNFTTPGSAGVLQASVGPWTGYVLDPHRSDLSAVRWSIAGSFQKGTKQYVIDRVTPVDRGMEVEFHPARNSVPSPESFVTLTTAGTRVVLMDDHRITVVAPEGRSETSLQFAAARPASAQAASALA